MSTVVPKIIPRGGGDRLEPSKGGAAPSGPGAEFLRELDARGQPNRPSPVPSPVSSPVAKSSKPSSGLFEPFRVDDIGSRLSDLRRSFGLTQTEVAKRMGASQPAIARIEKSGDGDSDALPNVVTLERYADALGCDLSVQFDAKSTPRAGSGLPSTVAAGAVCDGLANLRKSLGLMQKDIAAAMFTTQPVIARFEGGGGSPNLRTLERYAGALGIDVRFVLTSRGKA